MSYQINYVFEESYLISISLGVVIGIGYGRTCLLIHDPKFKGESCSKEKRIYHISVINTMITKRNILCII